MDLQDGQIAELVGPHHLGRHHAPVRQVHVDLAGLADNMKIGDDIPSLVDDDAGALAFGAVLRTLVVDRGQLVAGLLLHKESGLHAHDRRFHGLDDPAVFADGGRGAPARCSRATWASACMRPRAMEYDRLRAM